ncbi:MAG TPA: IS66 family transposase [Marinobacter sp.]
MLLAERDKALANKDRIIKAMEEAIRLHKLRRFGASSEKSADQHELFNEAELAVVVEEGLAEQDALAAAQAAPATDKPRKTPGRKPLPADLPRIRIEHDIPASDKTCPCGCARVEIGEDTSEQLEIIPAQIRVLVNARKKYACAQCEAGVITAPLPAQPIPKSNASPGLLAHIVTAKYQDALPLHRQEGILARHGIEIPRNTLATWMIKAGELVQPLLNLLEGQLLAYPVLHCDETPVQVLNEQGKRAQSSSYMWVRVGGPPTQPVRLFHYAPSRSGEIARHLLEGYRGYVQTDDYAGYNLVCAAAGITQLGCWAHARRKFVEASKVTAGTGKADVAIAQIGKLYAIEQRLKNSAPQERHRVRQLEAVPLLHTLRQWLDKTLHSTLPKGALGKALAYLDKNWDKLTVYTEDGRLSIDNNPAENAIRPFVVGRKNWLFSASVDGAKASANLYSLIETAKANGLEPYGYLREIFTRLPGANTVEDIEALLPWQHRTENTDSDTDTVT